MSWQSKIDDLDAGDKIEVDVGDTLVKGKFIRLVKSSLGQYELLIQAGKTVDSVENVPTLDIKNIRLIGG